MGLTTNEAAQNVASEIHKMLWDGDVLSGVSCGMQSTVLCDVISASSWKNLLDLWERYDEADIFRALKHLVTGAVDVPVISYEAIIEPSYEVKTEPPFAFCDQCTNEYLEWVKEQVISDTINKKTDMEPISIQGIDKAALLARLYNAAELIYVARRFGWMDEMSVFNARHHLKKSSVFRRKDGLREINVDLSGDTLDPVPYDLSNGTGAAAAVVAALLAETDKK